jgi:D-3-phosphoglycerate dehydrogenase
VTTRILRLNCEAFPVTEGERATLAAIGTVDEIEGTCRRQLLDLAAACDALVVVGGVVDASLVEVLGRCRVISRMGTGTDRIDVAAATRRGIVVTNVPDFCTAEVADHTMALLLAAARQLAFWQARTRSGQAHVQVDTVHRLATQTLGLVGLGRIGAAVAARARAFGFDLLAVDPAVDDARARQLGVRRVGLDALLAASDYVALLCPLDASTRRLIGAPELRRMKPSAVLINTSRGGLVDEDALAAALRDGRIRHAALDVFDVVDVLDPRGYPTDHPLFQLDNVTLTPHVAAFSVQAFAEVRLRAAAAVGDVLAGVWPAHPVNPEVEPWFDIDRP